MGKSQFVSPHSGKWSVKGAGNSKATAVFNTQAQAYNRARSIAQNQHSEVVVQGKNGQIRVKNSFGNDPCPPKDKD